MHDKYEKAACACVCHDGEKIFCSCFSPCCHEPYQPRARQTPAPVVPPVKVGDFKKFVFPLVRTKYPQLKI